MSPSMWPLWSKYEVLYFFRKFYKVHKVEVWVKTLVNKNYSSSLIITNVKLRFKPCMLNLIWKWDAKDREKREDHLIFINFGVKKLTLKNTQKKEIFDVWILQSPRSHGMRRCDFLRLVSNKVTSRSYNYFPQFSYFYFLRNWFFQLC